MPLIHRTHNTKIVATLGPASSMPDKLRQIFEAGVDVFRLNFSHADANDHRPRVEAIRALEKEYNHPVCIFGDLQGPKLRIGTFGAERIDVKVDQVFVLDQDPTPGDTTRVCLPHPEIFAAVRPGAMLLLDDGNVRLQVDEVTPERIVTTVKAGYRLSNRKGVNVPGTVLPISALTDKDRTDLEGALGLGVDWIALSFVQRPEDVIEAKKLINGRAGVIAKIEKPQALDRLYDIIQEADAIMVARGDLGVELPPEKVPSAQKRIVRMAREEGRPVIVATQMLESMVQNSTPTRAEASDVATAIFEGTDAIMLSAETAVGKHPVEAVQMMGRIANEIEHDPLYRKIVQAQQGEFEHSVSAAIPAAARQVADIVDAAAIVTFTTSGKTTLRVARERPLRPVVCLTADIRTARRMMLAYGVRGIHTEDIHRFSEMSLRAVALVKEHDLAKVGDKVAITAGVPFAQAGSTNILHIATVE
ncbi:MAG: pyruvate kinase [Bdellovibrionales bacterium]